jgi:radical SAM protein with 4Fe4S-binding SPASM domain
MPIGLSIEPTTACNLGCPECPSGLKMFSRPTGNIAEADFRAWIDQFAKHAVHLNFYFQGEPYIHRGFLEMVSYANGKGLFTSTSTNGHFLTDDVARKTVQSGLRRLIISIDGTTQEVYEQYRIHGKLDRVLRGAEAIIRAKRELKAVYPQVIFQFLVVHPNEHQVDDILQLGVQMGADEVRLKTAQVYDYQGGNALIPHNERYSRYVRLKDGSFRVKNSLDNHCWRMWSGCVITWNGKVVPCCFDKDATHVLGDLNSNSLRHIWNSTAYRSFRTAVFRSRSTIDICANCSEGTRVWTEA